MPSRSTLNDVLGLRDRNQEVRRQNDDKQRMKQHFKLIEDQCKTLCLDRANSRIVRVSKILDRYCTNSEIAEEFNHLFEAIEDDMSQELFSLSKEQRNCVSRI
jgi:hypothetical protein